MNKKLFTVTAGFVLATVTAISAFAADVTPRAVPDTATTFSIGAQNMVVDGAYNNANVFMGNLSGNDNEFWILRQHPTGNWRLYTAKAPIVGYGYTINRHINGTNCILWPDATDASTLRDSVVDLMTVSSGVQRIKLALSVIWYGPPQAWLSTYSPPNFLNLTKLLAIWSDFFTESLERSCI